MTLETAQILCTVVHVLGERALYKPTHARHPCVLWAGARRANYDWLVDAGIYRGEDPVEAAEMVAG